MKVRLVDCRECRENNRLFEISNILKWRAGSNYLSALAFDKEAGEILINKDSLMRAIQLANPGQAYRNIRLISNEEYRNLQDKNSDYTSWEERDRKEIDLQERQIAEQESGTSKQSAKHTTDK